MLEALREQLWQLHLELPKNGLVTWTGGNVSARDRETGLVVIQPSDVRYDDLHPEHMVIVDLNGERVEGTLKPSSDTARHLYIYRPRPDVNGVARTVWLALQLGQPEELDPGAVVKLPHRYTRVSGQ
ncbi:MAG TPA: class II aldolase/adducin family protein [Anaerolineae bacterium]|nr:class II aldolase/adducin family protein [Anaerolineae bacterium]